MNQKVDSLTKERDWLKSELDYAQNSMLRFDSERVL